MQRNDDADRIIRNVPWSPQKRDLGEEIYYDAVVHDAQLLYLLARHFPESAERGAAGGARSDQRGGQRQSGEFAVGGLHAARARRVRENRDRHGHARHHGDRQGRPRARADAAGRRDAEGRHLGGGGQGAVLEARAAARVLRRQRIGLRPQSCQRRRSNQGIEIIREFLDAKGNPVDARDGRRGVSRAAARARDAARPAAADRGRGSPARRRRGGARAAAAGRHAARPATIPR